MTEIFLDTANLEDIKQFLGWGIGTGVTTNQAIFLKEKGCNFKERAIEILDLVYPMPVSLEGPNDYEEIVKKAEEYTRWTGQRGFRLSNAVIKVPMMGNGDGLRAVNSLESNNIKTNVTACMTLNQAYLAASAGASYVSLFYNRMKDWWNEQHPPEDEEEVDSGTFYAWNTINETMSMLQSYPDTKLIVGSIRNPSDIEEILTANPDIITIPPKILNQMPFNEKTETTLGDFEKAWNEFKKSEKKIA